MTVLEVGAVGVKRMPLVSTPLASSSWRTKSAKKSLPSLPATATRAPSRAKSMAALAAQPPLLSSMPSTTCSSPASGNRGSGGTNRSATRTPTHKTSQSGPGIVLVLAGRCRRAVAGWPRADIQRDEVIHQALHALLASPQDSAVKALPDEVVHV